MIKDIDWLRAKVRKEYDSGLQYVQSERDRKRDIDKEILKDVPEWFIRSNLAYQHMQLEEATFLTDELDIKLVSDKWVLEDSIVKMAEKVAKFDYRKMWIKQIKRDIINGNNYYGIYATFIDKFDEKTNRPVLKGIDPLSIIPDPRNYQDSEMRFIGFEKTVTLDYIKKNKYFNSKARNAVIAWISEEQRKTEQATATANNVTWVEDDEMTTLVYFFTCYEGKKYMTIWDHTFENLLRQEELEALDEDEVANPEKIKYPIQLHRRKPKYKSFFGFALVDEVIDYQNAYDELVNLELLGVRVEELGSDKIVNQKLGIDINAFTKWKAGWITYEGNFSELGNEQAIVEIPLNKSGGRVGAMKQEIRQWAYNVSGSQPTAFGQSPNWQQTKAEIQILDKNSNKIHRYISSNYQESYQRMWEDIFKSYEMNMWEKATKNIALFDKWQTFSRELKKRDFLSGGTINIYVVSAEEIQARNKESFATWVALSGTIMPNMKPWYWLNSWMRQWIEYSGIVDADPYAFIPPTVDEREAMNNLQLLNNNEFLADPLPNQDLETLRSIYSQALDTPAKFAIIKRIDELIIATISQVPIDTAQTNGWSTAQAMNSVIQQANNNPQLNA